MSDNVMDKTKEKADTACNAPRDSYERDSSEDVKSGANSNYKTAGVEGQDMDEEKNEPRGSSDRKGAENKSGLDLK